MNNNRKLKIKKMIVISQLNLLKKIIINITLQKLD